MNLAHILQESADKYPDAPALVFGHETITYSNLLKRTNQLANALTGLGMGKDSKVALLLRNVPEFVISYYAILSIGGVVVPLCYMCMAEEVESVVCDAGVETLITNFEFDELVKKLQRSMCSQIGRFIVSESPELPDIVPFEHLVSGASEEFQMVDRDDDDLAVLLYAPTGAKTVRGCMLSHQNLFSNADTLARGASYGPKDVSMGVLPFFAAYGQTAVMNATLCGGGKIILQESFIPGEILKSLQHDGVTIFCGVPSMYVYMLNHPLIYQYDLSSVRLWVSGGAPLSKEIVERWNNELGAKLFNGYGLTETSPVVAIQPAEGAYKIGSIGVPIPGVHVKIVDEKEEEVPVGEVGELIVQGSNVMLGYYNKPEEQAQVLKDGWLNTGDMGYRDEDGALFLVGRKKDLIIRGGFNIYPREIEEVLITHPLITEAAVIGVPNKYLGEEVQAYIKLKPGATITEEQILEYCEDKLPYFKTPKFIKFVRSFKKDPSGQILKHLVEED